MSPLHFQVRTNAWMTLALLAASTPAFSDVVIIHDRASTIRLGGADAEEIAGLAESLLRRGRCTGGAPPLDELRALRVREVSVEVHYDEAREIALGSSGERTRPQHLFLPLTGDRVAGDDGEGAEIFGGRTSPADEPHYLGLAYVNPPDEYDVLYGTTYEIPAGLDDLRRAVARLGVDAPRPEPPHAALRPTVPTPIPGSIAAALAAEAKTPPRRPRSGRARSRPDSGR